MSENALITDPRKVGGTGTGGDGADSPSRLRVHGEILFGRG